MTGPKIRFKRDDGSDFPDWEEKRIGDVCKTFSGGTPKAGTDEYYGGNIPFIRSGEIHASSTELYVTEDGLKNSSAKMVEIGDVLYALYGATSGEVDISQIKGAINQAILCVRPNDNILKKFLVEVFRHNKESIIKTFLQGGQGNLSAQIILNLNFEFPSIQEQQKIADFLSNVDEVIAASEEEVANLGQQKKAVMQKIFSQEVRFKKEDGSDFPDWEEKLLEDVVEFLDGKRKPIEAAERKAGIYPYYGASGIVDYVKEYIFDEDLILLSEDGANIIDRNSRVCFMARGKYWVNNHAHVLKAIKGNVNEFICEQLESFDYSSYNTGSAQPKINQKVCRNLRLNISHPDEQKLIADFLASYDDAITAAKQELEKWKKLKKGLLQQMFV